MYACVTLGPKTVKSSWIVYKGLTWPKTCNHCHAIICNCNTVTMFPANALISTTVGSNFVWGGGLISQGRLLGHYFLLKLYRLSLLYKLLGGGAEVLPPWLLRPCYERQSPPKPSRPFRIFQGGDSLSLVD
jgi:hypothetical protein